MSDSVKLIPKPFYAGTSGVALCSREACPCWRGQLGLLGSVDFQASYCAVVGYTPENSCQVLWVNDGPEPADLWARLEVAVALEKARVAARKEMTS